MNSTPAATNFSASDAYGLVYANPTTGVLSIKQNLSGSQSAPSASTSFVVSVNWNDQYQNNGSGSITLNITPNFTSYSWTDGTTIVGTTNPLSVSPNSSTFYTLTSTDAFGCSVVSSPVTVSVTPLPSAPIVANTTQCGLGVSCFRSSKDG